MEEEYKELKAKFGLNLKKLRIDKGITQENLAIASELADSKFISKVESGEKDVQLITVFKLARGLGVKPKELLDFDI